MRTGRFRCVALPALLGMAALVMCLFLSTACRSGSGTEITIFAAASLRESFKEIADAFERSHPNTRIALNFAGSQTLRAQIAHGAAADVFASADEVHMDALDVAGRVIGAPRVFARNVLVLAVPANNPGDITHVRDLVASDVRIVLGASDVPVGRYARESLARYANAVGWRAFPSLVLDEADSFEFNVRLISAKIELGMADAGMVYRTEVQASDGAIVEVPLPLAAVVVAPYPIAVMSNSKAPAIARQFVDFVVSPAGQKTLASHGYEGAE